MSGYSVQEHETITAAVAKAVGDAGVKDGSQIAQRLIHDAQVFDLVEVVVPGEDGKSISLKERLAQMKSDDRWKSDFHVAVERPAPGRSAPIPTGAILSPDRAQFADLVSGKAVVR